VTASTDRAREQSAPHEPGAALAAARRELARLMPALDTLLDGLDESAWRARPLPDEWAPVEIVCHLRDEEREDFGARLRVVLAGGSRFVPIDPAGWAVDRRYREQDPLSALRDLEAARADSLAFLGTVAPGGLMAAVEHPALGRLSGLDLLVAWVTHDRLHLHQLTGTLARLWATRFAPLNAGYAGPIPYGPGAPG
jgi:hypothetical protein